MAGEMKYDEDTGGIATMCKVVESIREQSLKEGVKQGVKFVALRMLEAGKYALEEISAISCLPVEDVKKLQAEVSR